MVKSGRFKHFFVKVFHSAFEIVKIAVYIISTTQTCGVTVAQVILVHFVEVRILTGLPFFCPFSKIVSNPSKKHSVALANIDLPRNRVFFLPCSFLPLQKWDYSLFPRLPCASRPFGLRCSRTFGLRPPSNPYRSAIFLAAAMRQLFSTGPIGLIRLIPHFSSVDLPHHDRYHAGVIRVFRFVRRGILLWHYTFFPAIRPFFAKVSVNVFNWQSSR